MESWKKKEDNLRTSLGQGEFIKKPHEPRENYCQILIFSSLLLLTKTRFLV